MGARVGARPRLPHVHELEDTGDIREMYGRCTGDRLPHVHELKEGVLPGGARLAEVDLAHEVVEGLATRRDALPIRLHVHLPHARVPSRGCNHVPRACNPTRPARAVWARTCWMCAGRRHSASQYGKTARVLRCRKLAFHTPSSPIIMGRLRSGGAVVKCVSIAWQPSRNSSKTPLPKASAIGRWPTHEVTE